MLNQEAGRFCLLAFLKTMSVNLTEDDVQTIRDVLRQIGSGSSQGLSTVYTPNVNPALNGYNKPPKGCKFSGRNSKFKRQPHVPGQQQPVEPRVNPVLQAKMMRLAKMNLLGAHASTEGPLGYANKPTGAIKTATDGLSQIDAICRTGLHTSWDRIGRAPEDIVKQCLEANYLKLRNTSDITSEQRIKQLISSLRLLLIELNIPSDEFLKYFEEYLNLLIEEKNWISITPSTALFMAVNSEQDDGKPDEPNKDSWFTCKKCKYAYPPQKFPCMICGSTFKTISDLFAHNFEVHCKLVFESFQCEICCRDFGQNPIALRGHCNADHFCKFAHVECPYGCKVLIVEEGKGTLNQHLYTEHLCRICNDLVGKSLTDHQNHFHSLDKNADLKGNPIVEALTAPPTQPQVNGQASNGFKNNQPRKPWQPRSNKYGNDGRGKSFDRKGSKWDRGARSRDKSHDRKRRSRSRGSRSRRSRSREQSKRSKRSRSRDRSSRHSRDKKRSRSKSRYSRASYDSKADKKSEHRSFETHSTRDTNKSFSAIEIPIASPPQRMYSPLSETEPLTYGSVNLNEERSNPVSLGVSMPQTSTASKGDANVFTARWFLGDEKLSWLKCADCFHKVPPPGTYSCPVCPGDYELPSSLYRHVEVSHGFAVPRSFDCEFCSEIFINAAKWDDHMYAHHLCKVHRQNLAGVTGSESATSFDPREKPNVDLAVNVSYCTECEHSTWKGYVASEPRRGISSVHVKCPVPECPMMFHSQLAADRHFATDKRCASKCHLRSIFAACQFI